jgi:hypothetical protein
MSGGIQEKVLKRKRKKKIKQEFFTDKIAVNCKTKKQAKKFLKKLDKMGYRWTDGTRLTDLNLWNTYKEKTIFDYSEKYGGIMYGSVDYNENYKIVSYKNILEVCDED